MIDPVCFGAHSIGFEDTEVAQLMHVMVGRPRLVAAAFLLLYASSSPDHSCPIVSLLPGVCGAVDRPLVVELAHDLHTDRKTSRGVVGRGEHADGDGDGWVSGLICVSEP